MLGIDDGKFIPHTRGSDCRGRCFPRRCWLDGVMHREVAIDGLDSTEKLASMINASPHCRQLRLVMLNGVTFGGFNVVDIKKSEFRDKVSSYWR